MEMREAHLTADEVDHFLDQGDRLANRLFLHHLAVCPGCYAVAGHVLDLYQAGEIDLVDLCSIEISLALSRKGAPALLTKLCRHSFERQRALIRDTERFRTWGLCELLCVPLTTILEMSSAMRPGTSP